MHMSPLIKIFMIATLMNTVNAWSPSNYPFLPASTDTTKVRDMIIEAQGKNKRILDIGCGLGYSTSSSEGSLGIDMDRHNIKNAKKLFPDKNFRHSFVNAKNFEEEYDVVTCMFYLNNVPQYIRNKIGFRNILISDDISMKALKYGLKENVARSLNAGCNLILHCNGNINEMRIIANNVPKIDDFIMKKTSHFYKFLI